METSNLVDAIQSGDVQNSNNTFNELMADKINDALNAHKKDIAGQIYGTTDTKKEDHEDI